MEKVEQLTREVKQVEMRTARRTVVIVKKVVKVKKAMEITTVRTPRRRRVAMVNC